MKKPILALVAALALIPVAASAAHIEAKTATVVQDSADLPADAVLPDGTPAQYMDVVKTTVTRTEYENARSDTDFRADRPNPGRTHTETKVMERVELR